MSPPAAGAAACREPRGMTGNSDGPRSDVTNSQRLARRYDRERAVGRDATEERDMPAAGVYLEN